MSDEVYELKRVMASDGNWSLTMIPSPKYQALRDALTDVLNWADVYDDNMTPGARAKRDAAIERARALLRDDG